MRDVISLIDAICDVYDDPAYTPLSDGTTFCNIAVATVAGYMGCKDLFGKTADDIAAFIKESPDWSEIPFAKAQDMANQGSLLVAGMMGKDLGQSHGHVVILRPGKACYSGKWGLSPRCLNIGRENFIARAKSGPLVKMMCGLNEAFVEMPKIWAWRQSL